MFDRVRKAFVWLKTEVAAWLTPGDMTKIRAERARKIKRRSSPDTRPGKFRWRWNKVTVRGNTKSEARARMKAALGVKRLPIGAKVQKVIR